LSSPEISGKREIPNNHAAKNLSKNMGIITTPLSILKSEIKTAAPPSGPGGISISARRR
jgi:hypothetical protein